MLEERVKDKFKELIESANSLKIGSEYGQIKSEEQAYSCKGWLTSAQNLIHLVVSNPANSYLRA